MTAGWIKLHRQLLESRVFQNEGLLKIWIWCLLRANHRKTWVSIRTGNGYTEIELQPGQFLFGRGSASAQTRMNPTTVWKRMQKLKSTGNLNIESNSKCSIITIVNWNSYQNDQEKSDSESINQVTAKEQPGDTDKNDKNVKKLFSSDSIEIRLADLLLKEIKKRKPDFKTPNIHGWAKSIDLMIRLDGRKPSDIERVISWCQSDSFWQGNVLSTVKLRDKFDQLQLKMRKPNNNQPAGPVNQRPAKTMEELFSND